MGKWIKSFFETNNLYLKLVSFVGELVSFDNA